MNFYNYERNRIIGTVVFLLFLSSCSLFQTSRETISDENSLNTNNTDSSSATVSKAQYDDLLRKYENLARKLEDYEDKKSMGLNELIREEPPQTTSVLNNLAKVPVKEKSRPSSIDTVDVFAEVEKSNGSMSSNTTTNKDIPSIVSYDDPVDEGNLVPVEQGLEGEIFRLRKAISNLEQNQLDSAMKEFKELELSKYKQISVRAKNGIGQLLMKQNVFDLALQVFEEIVTSHAYSSVVVEALKSSVVCADKLGLADKKMRYESLLKDALGVNL